ncbi:ABC transporter ATP-binding protein [Gordonibacter massiliensis (ex Traore et al. 2017)]|uniref:ABC transporter ATP-binding protein n=1 Tax=Gordonibacter massiliensis (ex Traore et al. 2017) TaxID=1841863 RepID=UPI001FE2915C|nr:ABC transporter ATP-binding protein [Gordonibacter massiliensis (ex Traore et al. 2017)]
MDYPTYPYGQQVSWGAPPVPGGPMPGAYQPAPGTPVPYPPPANVRPLPPIVEQPFEPVLECRALSKRFGATVALGAVTLTVPRGRVVGLLGPNGSGKTTLIKLAAGLLQPTDGSVLVRGAVPGRSTKAIVSYLPERPYFAPSMKVSETLRFFEDFYADFDRRLAEDMLARLSVPVDAQMASLSKGTKEKVQLVLVMARHAALYLLDEPIGGVDPATRDYILDTIIANYHRDSTILLSTHLVADVERVLDDFIFLQYGTVVMHAPTEQMRAQFGMSLDDYFRGAFRC